MRSGSLVEEVEAIKHTVAAAFGIAVADLDNRDRRRASTIPRQIAVYLAKQRTTGTLTEIGRCFDLHHTSVLPAIAKIDQLQQSSFEVRTFIRKLDHKISETKSLPTRD